MVVQRGAIDRGHQQSSDAGVIGFGGEKNEVRADHDPKDLVALAGRHVFMVCLDTVAPYTSARRVQIGPRWKRPSRSAVCGLRPALAMVR